MPIVVGSLDELGLNYLLFVAHVSRSDALAFPARIAPERPEFGGRWITVFDAGADLSDLDADCLLAVKARLAPVIVRLLPKGPFRMILVSNSKYNDHLMACWQAMTVTDPSYPSNPETAVSVAEACRSHGLSRDAAGAAEAEMEKLLSAPA